MESLRYRGKIRLMPSNPPSMKDVADDPSQTPGLPGCAAARPGADTAGAAAAADAARAIPEVIIVEGESALAEMLQYAVSNAGKPARSFATGETAIRFLLEQFPAAHTPVILLDRDLLGSEGFLGLKRVVDARAGSRVIVLSAQGAERDQIRALRAGATD